MLLLVIYLFWQQLRENLPTKKTTLTAPKPSRASLLRQIHTACESDNHKALRIALCRWGSHVFQQSNMNLHSLADQFSEQEALLKTEIKQLMKVLYSAEKPDWNSQRLCQAVREYTPETFAQTQPSRIASLYPE